MEGQSRLVWPETRFVLRTGVKVLADVSLPSGKKTFPSAQRTIVLKGILLHLMTLVERKKKVSR